MSNHIFIIDDDIELTDLITEFLVSHNYHLTAFNDPLKGIDQILNNPHIKCEYLHIIVEYSRKLIKKASSRVF